MDILNILHVAPPLSPTGLTASPMATSIDLTWVQPTGDMVESYIISYTFSINGCLGEDGTKMIPLSDWTPRQYTLSGVEEDAGYTISITAMNGAGSSNPASIMTTTPIAGRYYISSCDP